MGRKKVNKYDETMTYADLETAMSFTKANCLQDEHDLLFYETLETAMQYDEEEGNSYICEIINEFAETTGRGKISAYWPWPVEVVGFSSLTIHEAGLSRPSEPGWNATTINSQVGSGRYVILTSGERWR